MGTRRGEIRKTPGEVRAIAHRATSYHVASDGSLWRRNAETLTEDAHPVGEARAVPEQHPVGAGQVLHKREEAADHEGPTCCRCP